MKLKMLLPIAAAVLAVVAVFMFAGGSSQEEVKQTPSKSVAKKPSAAAERHHRHSHGEKIAAKSRTSSKERQKIDMSDLFDHLKGDDRAIAEAIQKGLDDDDFKTVAAWAEKALKSESAEVRQHAVESLGWFGAQALPELTVWMSDRNEDVAQEAMEQWSGALTEVERADDRFSTALAAFGTISDKDMLQSIGMELSSAADEIIDGEEDETRAAEKRVLVVQALAEIIVNGAKVNSAAAKEAFEDITGNEWISVEEAEKYLRDPENYEAPDTDSDADGDSNQ